MDQRVWTESTQQLRRGRKTPVRAGDGAPRQARAVVPSRQRKAGPAGVRTHRGLAARGRPGSGATAAGLEPQLRRRVRQAAGAVVPKAPPSQRKLIVSAAVVALLWGDSVLVGSLLAPPREVRIGMLALHLASMILGLGAVLVLDHAGLQYLLGRKSFREVMNMAEDTHLPIWLGYGGLLLSGAFLAPSLGKPIVLLKMLLVLGCGLGGVNAMRLGGLASQWRPARPDDKPPARLVVQVLVAGGISQLCWWGAFAVGMVSPYVD